MLKKFRTLSNFFYNDENFLTLVKKNSIQTTFFEKNFFFEFFQKIVPKVEKMPLYKRHIQKSWQIFSTFFPEKHWIIVFRLRISKDFFFFVNSVVWMGFSILTKVSKRKKNAYYLQIYCQKKKVSLDAFFFFGKDLRLCVFVFIFLKKKFFFKKNFEKIFFYAKKLFFFKKIVQHWPSGEGDL